MADGLTKIKIPKQRFSPPNNRVLVGLIMIALISRMNLISSI